MARLWGNVHSHGVDSSGIFLKKKKTSNVSAEKRLIRRREPTTIRRGVDHADTPLRRSRLSRLARVRSLPRLLLHGDQRPLVVSRGRGRKRRKRRNVRSMRRLADRLCRTIVFRRDHDCMVKVHDVLETECSAVHQWDHLFGRKKLRWTAAATVRVCSRHHRHVTFDQAAHALLGFRVLGDRYGALLRLANEDRGRKVHAADLRRIVEGLEKEETNDTRRT